MREILFKAKRIDNGEWIEGSFLNLDSDSGYCYIVPAYETASTLPIKSLILDRMKLVDPETICQFTGLTDKNGKKIWENDIVTCRTKYGGDIGKVVFHNGKFCKKHGENKHILKDSVRDSHGNYHDDIIYEIIND